MSLYKKLAVLMAGLAGVGCVGQSAPPLSGPLNVGMNRGDLGKVPAGFSVALTGGGVPPEWSVREDAGAPGGAAVVQESKDETSYRFPMCIYDGAAAKDVTAEVKFKTISGTVDQAGGVVVRYAPENYYIARANALEDNINLFKTVNGNRLKIAEVETKVTPRAWHTLALTARGSHLTVAFDGKTVIEADDATFQSAGKVGLWTKADSVTAFAELRIAPVP